jgi:hypothetical protein
LERAEEMGKRFGPLLTLPDMEAEDYYYVQAFHDLNRARSYHMGGPNPIALADIDAYIRLAGLSDDTVSRRVLLKHIAAMDDVLISYSSDKRQAEADAAKRERAAKKR